MGVRERTQRRMAGRDAPRNVSRYDKEKERDRQIGKSIPIGGIKTLDAPELHCHLKKVATDKMLPYKWQFEIVYDSK